MLKCWKITIKRKVQVQKTKRNSFKAPVHFIMLWWNHHMWPQTSHHLQDFILKHLHCFFINISQNLLINILLSSHLTNLKQRNNFCKLVNIEARKLCLCCWCWLYDCVEQLKLSWWRVTEAKRGQRGLSRLWPELRHLINRLIFCHQSYDSTLDEIKLGRRQSITNRILIILSDW